MERVRCVKPTRKFDLKVGVWILFSAVLMASVPPRADGMTYGSAIYTDTTANSNGIYGWGVTDVQNSGCYCHWGTVSTTLRSPNGRMYTGSAGGSGSQYARADVWLAFDANDLGDYTSTSTHRAYCPYCRCYYINGSTTTAVIKIGTAVTNYIYTDNEGYYCLYFVYCPNGNTSLSCPATNPVYVDSRLNVCRNYLHDTRLKVTYRGIVKCFPIGIAHLANFAVNCS